MLRFPTLDRSSVLVLFFLAPKLSCHRCDFFLQFLGPIQHGHFKKYGGRGRYSHAAGYITFGQVNLSHSAPKHLKTVGTVTV